MANEPEHPIEKLLRAAAKKRRDEAGAPLELHPATRRLLQSEVARTFAKPKRETRSFSAVFGRLWLRLALGVATFALLAEAVYILLPVPGKGKPETLLAENEPAPQAVPSKQPLTPPPSATATVLAPPPPAVQANPPTVALAETAPPARQLGIAAKPASPPSVPAARTSPAPVAPMPAAAPVVAANEPAKLTSEKAGQPAFAYAPSDAAASAKPANATSAVTDGLSMTPGSPEASPRVSFSLSEGEKAGVRSPSSLGGSGVQSASQDRAVLIQSTGHAGKAIKSLAVAQRFAQVAPGAKTKAAHSDKAAYAHPVLVSFQVEQAGRDLRIVDGDGSVYSGYVQIADAARRRRSAKAETAPAVAQAARSLDWALEEKTAAPLDSDRLTPQTYFFRVAGTNRSLNKKVVFTGDLIATTNAPSSQPVTNLLRLESALAGGRVGSAQPELLPLLNARILGKVVVGNGKAVEINALPTSP